MGGAEPAIQVQGLTKTFRIPTQTTETLKERAVRPWERTQYHEIEALRDVSFEVQRGEFFGVVGRNGSGKSTLLKLLASIYAPDAGEIRVAGDIAPFIELAVGFNVEFTARENVLLNGVMMGLTRREAERRFGAIMEFAELEEYAGMKLKNYSSGMLTRLAFSIMVQVDADVMLIDEVLAVGDAGFQAKCAEVFAELRGKRTIVFVTHDMRAVERFCHRALLIDRGAIELDGEPGAVARRYLDLNRPATPEPGDDGPARFDSVWVEDEHGERPYTIEHGRPLTFRAVIDPREPIGAPRFSFQVRNSEGVWLYSLPYAPAGAGADRLEPGQPVEVSATIASPFAGGQYSVNATLVTEGREDDLLALADEAVVFMADGPGPAGGIAATRVETHSASAQGLGAGR